MKSTLRNALFSGMTALALISAPAIFAASSPTNSAPDTKVSYPFKGIVDSVDNSAKTVSLKKKDGERVLHIDSASVLIVDGKPAVLSDVKPMLYAHGTLHKESGTNEFILSAKFDKEPPAKKIGTNAVSDDATPPVKKHKKKSPPASTNSVPPATP